MCSSRTGIAENQPVCRGDSTILPERKEERANLWWKKRAGVLINPLRAADVVCPIEIHDKDGLFTFAGGNIAAAIERC